MDELLDDESIPPASRIIGLLVLVFAQRISDCVRLRRSDVSEDETALRITFGRTPLALPAPIAELLHHYVIELEAERPFVSGGPDWLFPGTTPHLHVSEGCRDPSCGTRSMLAGARTPVSTSSSKLFASVVIEHQGQHRNLNQAPRAASSRWGDYPDTEHLMDE